MVDRVKLLAGVLLVGPLCASFLPASYPGLYYFTGGGSANAQTVTPSPVLATALYNGLAVCWLPVAANTLTNPTLAVNGLAATTITKLGTAALAASDLTTTAVACAVYDGTEFQLQNPQTAASAGVAFSAITSGTNTAATMTVGAGATLTFTSTGVLNANQINGATVPTSAVFLASNGSSQLTALTATTATAALNLFTATLQGLVPLSGGGTTNFLRADGNWAAPPATVPCTSTALSVQFNNAGAFGCVAQLTYATPTLTYLNTGLGTTESDALFYENITAAAAGAQQISPAIHFQGQGWKTNATAGSQQVDVFGYIVPVQQAANPDVTYAIFAGINGTKKTNAIAYFCADGTGAASIVGLFGLDGGANNGCNSVGGSFTGIGGTGTAGQIQIYSSGTNVTIINNNAFDNGAGRAYGWSSGVNPNGTLDTAVCRAAAGLVLIYNGPCATTAANMRDLELRSLVAGGSVPSISGCSAGTQTGGATAGTMTSGTTGACTVTVTFATTAPTGWVINVHDTTTVADVINQTASTTTSATFSGTTVTSDVLYWEARAF